MLFLYKGMYQNCKAKKEIDKRINVKNVHDRRYLSVCNGNFPCSMTHQNAARGSNSLTPYPLKYHTVLSQIPHRDNSNITPYFLKYHTELTRLPNRASSTP